MVFAKKPETFNPRFEVSGCLLECDGSFLILERQLHKPQGGSWGMPAGKLDAGESSKDALIREMQQETGFLAREQDVRFIQKLYVRYPEYDFVYDLYRCPLAERPEVIINPSEHSAFRWVTPAEALAMNLIPGFDACLRIVYGENIS
jgi:8-oxo-dGTP pyrophosphatase MutT (NUDIX family)